MVSQARLLLRLPKTKIGLRRSIVQHMRQVAPSPHSRLNHFVQNALSVLSKVGLSTARNALRMRKKHASKQLVQCAASMLLHANYQKLKAGIEANALPASSTPGRSDTQMFPSLVWPSGVPAQYNEWGNLSCLPLDEARAIVKLKLGSVNSRRTQHKFGRLDDPSCPCGAGIQDATHLIWECPHTQTHRNDILDSIKCVAQKHGMLEGLIKDMAPSDMLKLSMGGKVTHFVPFHHRAISTLMQGSAPQWLAFYSFIETTGV